LAKARRRNYMQSSRDGILGAGDGFWHLNLMAGYRSPGRRFELMAGLLNLTGQDYKLNPLTAYQDLPRERTFVARVRLNF